MKRLACGALLCILPSLLPAVALAQSLPSTHWTTRHKTGAITLRGVVRNAHSGGFTLETRTRGAISVTTRSATAISEKGKAGHVSIRTGDHVSVRGLLSGRSMVAIRLRIFPIKPKAFSIKGSISTRSRNQIVIVGSGKTTRAELTTGTEVRRGSRIGSVTELKPGVRVEARLVLQNNVLVVLRIHIYRVHAAAAKHLRLHGTILRASRTSVSVESGGRVTTVAVSRSTRVFIGRSRVSMTSLKSGQTATIYACCAGRGLSATSIHIRKSVTAVRSTLIRGRVISISKSEITITTATGNSSAAIGPTTIVELGSSPEPSREVRIGDEVSIRVIRVGPRFDALRIHIFVSSRKARALSGVLVSVSGNTLTIITRGKRYRLSLSATTTISLNGRSAHLSSLQAGDHIRVKAQPNGAGLLAVQIVAKRLIKKARLTTIRGTVAKVLATGLTVVDSFGSKHEIHIPAGVRIRLHGKIAPVDAVFVGASISARGLLLKGALVARTLTLSVKSRKLEGRVATVSSSRVVLILHNRQQATLDLLKGARITDGGKVKSWLAIRKDAYLGATGYVEPSLAVRTSKAAILHPLISLAATVVSTKPDLLVEATTKDRYRLDVLPSTRISTGASQVSIVASEIFVGAHVHFSGKAGSNGSVSLSSLLVRLARLTIRGTISVIGTQELHVQTVTGAILIKLPPSIKITQGSRPLQLTDLVERDDVTAYGYAGAPGVMFGRRIAVHRRVLALTGTVEAVAADYFVLSAADGPHRILTTGAILFSGGSLTDIVVGTSLHVTGYLRGDTFVIASRITFKKTKKKAG